MAAVPEPGNRSDQIGRAPLRRIATLLAAFLALAVPALAAEPALALGLIRDAEIEGTLKRLADPLVRAAGLKPQAVKIFIVNDPELNAFVAGGANIFLNSGLLMTLETPEELQAVIAHELGHITGGHEARRSIELRRARGPALIGMLAGVAAGIVGGGDAAAAVAMGSQGVIQRSLLAYTRAEEATADQAALDYLARARIDPSGLLRVLERFRGQEVLSYPNLDPYVLTHPLSTERMQLVERRVRELAGRARSADPDLAYWHRRMRAKLQGFIDPPERVLNQLEGKPESEEVLYAKAVALWRRPDLKAGLAAVDRLIARRPRDPFYIELKAQILFESGRAEEAVPLYREAVRLAPGEPLILGGLGRALLALHTPEADREALEVLQRARAKDPADAMALRALAEAYSRAGDYGMAALATAERYALTGRKKDAVLMARRASATLPQGSPGWRRAEDILALDVPGAD